MIDVAGAIPIQKFGDALLRTLDLDPVYVGLVQARLPEAQLSRWLLAYWAFYHMGVASWLSEREGDAFWGWMETAARNEPGSIPASTLASTGLRWPRGTERRHFRGDKAIRAVSQMSRCSPEWFAARVAVLGSQQAIMNQVQTWPQFGPWIAFKVADMVERVIGSPVTFSQDLGLVFKEPRAALDILAGTRETLGDGGQPSTAAGWWSGLQTYFGARWAPPDRDGKNRRCNVQEVETICCKWKSHAGGHYYVGKDITETRHALAGWGDTASQILRYMPRNVLPEERVL